MLDNTIIKQFQDIQQHVHTSHPLVHCLTNHITINDCANVILAVGGQPMMAEHLLEVEEVTASAKALVINLGNITDARMEAMRRSGNVARKAHIPSIIDCVGVASIGLRRQFAEMFIESYTPSVIKGNASEIRALLGQATAAKGIDVSDDDVTQASNKQEMANLVATLARRTGAVVVATGAIDLVSDGYTTYSVYNGCPNLARVTGTGCMLGVMIATYMTAQPVLESALLGTLMMGLAGELADNPQGIGSFKIGLMDALSTLQIASVVKKIKVEVVE